MSPTIYVIKVKDHPEYPAETVVGQTPMTAAQVYVQGYSVPEDYAGNLRIYDCYEANMYVLVPKDE